MTILKGLLKAEWEHNQPREHSEEDKPISIMDGLITLTKPFNYDNVTIENCYAAELPKVHRLLHEAYAAYDHVNIHKYRVKRSQYKSEIAEYALQDIERLNVTPEYEDTGDGVTPLEWCEAYLESMYSSGIPMNQTQTKALELIRGTKS